MQYKLVIPGRLPGLNEYIDACRANQYSGSKIKRKSQAVVMAEAKRQLRNLHIGKPVKMKYIWYEKDRRRDLDNISSFGRKVIQDALVGVRVLANDGWSNITGFSDDFEVDKKNPRIEVEIVEVEL